jgi:hypothetical protein
MSGQQYNRDKGRHKDVDPEVEVMCRHVYAMASATLAVFSLVVFTFLLFPLPIVIMIPHPDLVAQYQKAASEVLKLLPVISIIGAAPLGCELVKRL